ncbi:hypothetical protein BDW02DRAFT_562934 [Decorospora gaudefroyi]|uniref:Gfd2/YDR514C-like C-terminal domain-containing protein n=1 Tax=Decorospora gaudefroyi TaxID=184978 RepID=A0A6A5JY14_9PLEO|nr:hypothetical protein BDW02DRAFT_562934 [Decorospora gaudefroyi]
MSNELLSTSQEVTSPAEVSAYFRGLEQTEIMEYCLGFDKPNAPSFAEHVLLIALACGGIDGNLPTILDLGLHTIQREDVRQRLSNPGPHSANVLRSIAYHHLRLEKTARHANRLPNPLDAESNRFGVTRFVNGSEAKVLFEDSLCSPIQQTAQQFEDLEPLQFCPIVLLSHNTLQFRILHDTLSLHPTTWQHVVATITTERIAHEQGFDWRGGPLSLSQLTQDLKIEYPSPQSAADNAAYTILAAVQMVMRSKIPLAKESLQSVVNVTMLHSQSTDPTWGDENFCTHCGMHDHRRRTCLFTEAVICMKCVAIGMGAMMYTHIEGGCPW